MGALNPIRLGKLNLYSLHARFLTSRGRYEKAAIERSVGRNFGLWRCFIGLRLGSAWLRLWLLPDDCVPEELRLSFPIRPYFKIMLMESVIWKMNRRNSFISHKRNEWKERREKVSKRLHLKLGQTCDVSSQ